MKRRNFMKKAGLGLFATQSYPFISATEILSNNITKVPVGLCNHSLRSMRLNAQQLIEFAIKHKMDSVLFNNFQPLESIEESYLKDLRNLANSGNISIYIGVGSISEKSPGFRDNFGTARELLKKGIQK